ncbi:cytochrome P450 [Lentzea sp. NPDC004782]|uniref:cytochrome P450 n=1 Tax=Lentzea sp. NPDC004782 TaxID=3154458 RepID=UPI0033A04937
MDSGSAIPIAPRSLPLVGHAPALLRNPLGFLSSLPSHGDLVRVRIGSNAFLVVCSAQLTSEVLRDDATFDRGGPIFARIAEMTANGLAACPHSEHRRQRRMLQPAFTRARLRGYAQVASEQIVQHIDDWRDGQRLDVVDEMLKFAGKALIASVFTGASPTLNTALRDALADLSVLGDDVLFEAFAPPLLKRVPNGIKRRSARVLAGFGALVAQVIEQYRRDEIDHRDLLSMLILGDGQDRRTSDEEIIGQILTFFFAGTETIANALAWSLYQLSLDADLHHRLCREVDAIARDDRTLGLEEAQQLELTGRVLTEALRLHPPGWLFTRKTSRDTILGGYQVPAGTDIIYSPYVIHHRPDLYPAPDRFDPGRWEPDRSHAGRSALIPFGGGARRCIGDNYAMAEGVIALATITARWHLEPSRTRIRPSLSLVMSPRNLVMTARART